MGERKRNPKVIEGLHSTQPEKIPTAGQSHQDDFITTLSSWCNKVRWFNFTMLITIPLVAFLQVPWVPMHRKTLVLSIIYYVTTAISVTAGYHRLWAHRSYSASPTLKWLLAAFGAGAVQGSIKFWVREHRAHHRYTDTDQDPYNVKKGLLHAHILWVITKQPRKNNRVDISDLQNDCVVALQHRYYFLAAFFMGWGFPTLVAGLGWNDWYGGFLYAGILRSFFVNQATFCVNSLAHWIGEQPYDDRRSSRDHLITALITMGEGYHNFHHEFPSDYRNGIEWYQPDITKWAIRLCEQLGLAYDLKRFRQNEIGKSRLQQVFKKLNVERESLDWGPPLSELPVMEWDEYHDKVTQGHLLILIGGVVHDVSKFIHEHPGGESMMRLALGKDATTLFNGAVYLHSNAANNILATLRVAILRGGCEVEIFKQQNNSIDMLAKETPVHVQNLPKSIAGHS
ncbi:fatty acid desaturase [Aspergillus piperis CBS 112811]|uniref:Acyl-CoA desaturase n=1 Tax=Aspergillus piperis CBS 112811 TaxID=1448313 RepID=A0A8G1R7N0_9EURO|nr:fatty acid desaturase [Aspergillus piperis CBS 112811]RAH59759.1 fatty acid desaturase [Aspergillus piperis CBS 112811]